MYSAPPPHFPLEVRLALQRASQVQNTELDPQARIKAINAAVERARRMHPEMFREFGHETRGS